MFFFCLIVSESSFWHVLELRRRFVNESRSIHWITRQCFFHVEFMISTFVHELLSREFVILMISAICINVESNSKNVLTLVLRRIFFSSRRSFFIHEKAFSILWILWRRTWRFRDLFANFLRSSISFEYDASNRFSFFFFTLQFEIHAMCSRLSHASHFLCLSMMLRSQSLMRCLFAHVSYTITMLQC
jgi:hypothetical protein